LFKAFSSCAPVKGRPLLGQRLEDRARIASANRRAQFVRVLPARAHDAAVLALEFLRPHRQRAIAPFEVVGAAGRRVDLRGDDVDVCIVLVIVGDKNRLGVPHAERVKRAARRLLHLLARRLLARPPGERQVHAILFAFLGLAVLIERVKFHDLAGEVGSRLVDLEGEAGPANPRHPAFLAGGQLLQLAGLGVAPLPEHIAHGSGDPAAGIDPGVHRLKPEHPLQGDDVQLGRSPLEREGLAQLAPIPQVAGRIEVPGDLVWLRLLPFALCS
jgi:hypothetical protein